MTFRRAGTPVDPRRAVGVLVTHGERKAGDLSEASACRAAGRTAPGAARRPRPGPRRQTIAVEPSRSAIGTATVSVAAVLPGPSPQHVCPSLQRPGGLSTSSPRRRSRLSPTRLLAEHCELQPVPRPAWRTPLRSTEVRAGRTPTRAPRRGLLEWLGHYLLGDPDARLRRDHHTAERRRLS